MLYIYIAAFMHKRTEIFKEVFKCALAILHHLKLAKPAFILRLCICVQVLRLYMNNSVQCKNCN